MTDVTTALSLSPFVVECPAGTGLRKFQCPFMVTDLPDHQLFGVAIELENPAQTLVNAFVELMDDEGPYQYEPLWTDGVRKETSGLRRNAVLVNRARGIVWVRFELSSTEPIAVTVRVTLITRKQDDGRRNAPMRAPPTGCDHEGCMTTPTSGSILGGYYTEHAPISEQISRATSYWHSVWWDRLTPIEQTALIRHRNDIEQTAMLLRMINDVHGLTPPSTAELWAAAMPGASD